MTNNIKSFIIFKGLSSFMQIPDYGNAISLLIGDQYHALPYIVHLAERLRHMYKNIIASAYAYV